MSYSNYSHSNINVVDNLFKELTKKKPKDEKKNPQNKIINEIKKHDVEYIEPSKCIKKYDDLSSMFYKLIVQFNFKIAFLIFVFYIIFNTDIFNKFVISKFEKNIYVNDSITEKGLIIIGVLLSISYIILDVLNNNDYI
jgi:hypothetical protein